MGADLVLDKRVSAIAVGEYDVVLLTTALERHFDALGVWDDLYPGMRVVLKPNLLSKHAPDDAVTTHPAMVEAVCRILLARGISDITLADSPGGPYKKSILRSVYAGCGMQSLAERTGIKLNTDTGWKERHCDRADVCRSFNIITPIADADFIINLPKLKTHAMTTLSCGVKNLFGCVPGLQKPEFHLRFPDQDKFCRMLVDLSLLVETGVTVVDAIVGMEGNGPSGGEARHIGMTFAARNVHVLDLAMAAFIGLPAEAVYTVAHSTAVGLCPTDSGCVDWLCDGAPSPISDYRHPKTKALSFGNHVPRWFRAPLEWAERTFIAPRPVISRRQCIGCGKCKESCAPKAVSISGGKAGIDYSRCICCYCCQEMCPVKAVNIRRTGILKA